MNASIYEYVATNYKGLFKRVLSLDDCQNQLQFISQKSVVLSDQMSKIKKKINNSYEHLRQDILEFQNLQRTCFLLFYISRIALLVKRVNQQQQQNSLFKDLNQTSLHISELEYIFENIDWKGIHILEFYNQHFLKLREHLINQSWKLINSSYELSDQTQLALGLHVRYF